MDQLNSSSLFQPDKIELVDQLYGQACVMAKKACTRRPQAGGLLRSIRLGPNTRNLTNRFMLFAEAIIFHVLSTVSST